MRDLVAAILNESSTNVARMDAINNNATPEIKEQLKEGNLGITAAYEAIIKQRGGRNVEIKQENEVVNV